MENNLYQVRLYNNRKGSARWILYFLFPIFSLIEAIRCYRLPSAKNLFWFFCAFYGLVHIYMPEGTIGREGADSVRYAIELEQMHNKGVTWEELRTTLYSGETGGVDLYQPIVTFFVSRFTGNAHVLFCIYGIVFGFFYSRNIWYILSKCPQKLGFQLGVFILAFALLTPIWQINGVRMWTALQVFMYGFLPYIIDKDKSKIWWSYSSFLFHFSFLSMVALMLIFQLVPKRRLPYLILFILTFFIGQLDIAIVREKLLSLGLTAFDSKINIYTADYALENMMEGRLGYSWHVTLAKDMGKYIYQGLIIISYFALNKLDKSKVKALTNLFCTAAFFYSYANIVATIPSGARFAYPAQMLSITTALLISLNLSNSTLRNWYTTAAWGLIYPIIFSIREGMDYWGISLLVTNPITCWYFEDNSPIIEFIKSIL